MSKKKYLTPKQKEYLIRASFIIANLMVLLGAVIFFYLFFTN